jgi:2-oxoglutarate/2-oxoacid ferredoxin oxidoreductase subunit alpha
MTMPERVENLPIGRRRYFSGNEAAAHGALAAGCRFYAGYPITPSSEIMESMAKDLPGVGGTFIQMEDEIASISAVIGASWSGAKAMTATSGPGLSLMQEGLGYAAFTETPLVVIDVQRAGPCTGQATKVGGGDLMAVKWGSHGDYQVVAFSPWSVEEMFTLTIEAFNWSERLRVPAFLLAEEATGHLRESVTLPARVQIFDRDYRPGEPPFGTPEEDGVPSMPRFGLNENLLVTGSTHDAWGFRKVEDPDTHDRLVRRLERKVLSRQDRICRHEALHLDSASLVVVAYGFTARAALKAVRVAREEGLPVGLLRLVTIWPFDYRLFPPLASAGCRFLVPEMNMGQLSHLVRSSVGEEKVLSLTQTNGTTITPGRILTAIREVI